LAKPCEDITMTGSPTFHTTLATPLGPMRAAFDGPALVELAFVDAHATEPTTAPAQIPAQVPTPVARNLAALHAALDAYFSGRDVPFDVPLAPSGTPFQREVWSALRDIPFGATASYAEIARRIGRPRAVRAVGAANARNPIAILVPCHRVIGADGSLTGYAGGLERKRALLSLESGIR
jgi:methylated-DNA-[protein]-cysteine S-methyltransferase